MSNSESPTPRRLFDAVRDVIRLKLYSLRTEEIDVYWIRRFIYFHGRLAPEAARAGESARSRSLSGHSSVETTMVYTHVMNKGGRDKEPAGSDGRRVGMYRYRYKNCPES